MLYRLKPDVATTIPTIGESLHERENAHVARFITSDECILHIYVISSKYCMLLKPCWASRNVHGTMIYTNVAAVKGTASCPLSVIHVMSPHPAVRERESKKLLFS